MTIDLGRIQLVVKLKETDLRLMEMVLQPGAESRLHRHTRERESFWVKEGSITFTLEGGSFVVTVGEVVSIPIGALHRFQNTSTEPARAVLVLNPGALANYFVELRALLDQQAPAEAFVRLNARYGLEFERP